MINYDILICNEDFDYINVKDIKHIEDFNIVEIKDNVAKYKITLPLHICNTIEEASQWIQCTRDTLYKSLHLNGVMRAKGFIVELVKID